MKQEITNEEFGKIIYEESSLSGKKSISINDVVYKKVNKTTFKAEIDGEEKTVYLKGNVLSGVVLTIDGKNVQVVPATKWYEYIMFFFPFVLVLIWGNVVALCEIVPVVGGAIGGFISALVSILALFIAKKTNNILFKVLLAIAATAIAFGICAAIGTAIVAALS